MDLRFIDEKRKRIEFLFEAAPKAVGDSFELRSHWARYVCVVVSGYIESSIRQLLTGYCADRSSPAVARYAASKIRWFQNAEMDRIVDLFCQFDPAWEQEILHGIDDEHKAAVNSIIGNRHSVAHGDTSSITISSLRTWYGKANEVIDLLVGLCAR